VPTGSDLDPDGTNLWSTSLGGSTESTLWQGALFGFVRTDWTPAFSSIVSVRAETIHYAAQLPTEVGRATAAQRAIAKREGEKQLGSGALSLGWRAAAGAHFYATWQRGPTLQPSPGGTVNSKSNFAMAELKEIGGKFSLLDENLFAGLSAYRWNSARFNDRENRAERLRGQGVELEITWAPTTRLSIIASTGAQRVYRLDALGFRVRYGTAEKIALESGSLDAGGTPTPTLNPQLIYPGSPESQAKIDIAWQATEAWGASLGAVWSHAFYHNFERTLVLPESLVWRGSIDWQHGSFTVRLSGENLLSQDYFLGADPYFAHNNLVTKAPPLELKLTAGWRF
jgi:hypothetical protein